MSDYSFKNLSDIDTVESPADGATIMGFQSGTPIQMPMSAVGGGGVFVINHDDPDYSLTDAAYGDKIKEALLSGKQVWVCLDCLPKLTATKNLPKSWFYYNLLTLFTVKENDDRTGTLGIAYHDLDGNNTFENFAITV